MLPLVSPFFFFTCIFSSNISDSILSVKKFKSLKNIIILESLYTDRYKLIQKLDNGIYLILKQINRGMERLYSLTKAMDGIKIGTLI